MSQQKITYTTDNGNERSGEIVVAGDGGIPLGLVDAMLQANPVIIIIDGKHDVTVIPDMEMPDNYLRARDVDFKLPELSAASEPTFWEKHRDRGRLFGKAMLVSQKGTSRLVKRR